MKYIVAVSGGVDSIVLLDMLYRANIHELIVAHFDHGIRPDSTEDARFVEAVAKKYRLPFESKREELGADASEAQARDRRYAFLNSVAEKYDAQIATAHHLDDIVETIAINLIRGTGWRGLAVLGSRVYRPLLDMEKAELLKYAKDNNLQWREDSTNASDAYLRNRLRKKTMSLPASTKRELRALQVHQKVVKRDIEHEVKRLVGDGPRYSRYFFISTPTSVAIECLRYITGGKLTRPQLTRLLYAIKTARSNTTYQAGEGIQLNFSSRKFSF